MKLTDVAPKPFALAAVLLVLAGAVVALEQPWAPRSTAPPPPADLPAELARFPAAPDFAGATGWLQSEPLDLVALRGQVVLVDFWTYSCINCIRTFPHVAGWWERYRDHGLVVVGVHTPEFRFERDAANVQAAALRHNLTYPVAQDNDYGVWQAYHNRYWPAKYLVDGYGRIRYTHFGEGAYLETEHVLRQLLTEAGHGPLPAWVEQAEPQGPGRVDLTPELYAAGGRVAIGNREGYRPGQTITYAPPANLARDRIFLEGPWLNEEEFVQAEGPGSVLVRFRAADAVLVVAGAEGACVPVRLDGGPVPQDRAGRDVLRRDGATCLPLDGARSYQFYAGPLEEHLVEVQVPAGFQLFTFAFSSTGRS